MTEPHPVTTTDPSPASEGDAPQTAASDASDPSPAPVAEPSRIHVTEAAVEAIREMLDEAELEEEGGLRISARTGAGCSVPLQYGMTMEAAPDTDDRILEGRGVRIFMDPESAWVLDGLVVDYVRDSPMGEGFAFRHPNGPSGRAC
ncbi:MAG: iron-sulfur cluster assembly accessory protein [Longimicrobiales bacterium]|nr:iron-sulfur cluster assembly accessory protein [Longimicrobiales bacterium]